jgi:parallel beta-helix repeat protein
MKRLTICTGTALGLGAMTTLALLWLLSGLSRAVRANDFVVCPAGPPTCGYSTIQAAVDAADDGDVIQVVTGVYTGVHQRGGITQVVHVNKSLTLRGGYTLTQGTVFNPQAYPVTLDAQGQGRVLYAAAPTLGAGISLTLEGLRFIGGNAARMGGDPQGDAGGGIYVGDATLTLKNSQVSSNTASDGNGGGLYIKSSSATLSDNIISLNDANSGGGGLYISASVVIFNHNFVSSNHAFSVGGLFQFDSDATFTGNTFSSNHATFGCGVSLASGNATFNNNVVSFNTSGETGGGLCLTNNNATLKDNLIVSNAGVFGGGLRILDSNATLSGNSILSNTAHIYGRGGGLYVSGSTITLTANTISFNKSQWYFVQSSFGGGLSVSDSTITLDRNTILSNTAVQGGGMYLDSVHATLVNNVIADNQAETLGSGLYLHLSGDDSRLLHNTIARNGSSALTAGSGGDGSGIYVTGLSHTLALTNTILVSHAVGITVTAGNMAVLQGTLWGNASDWGGAGIIVTGTHNAWGNPAFVDPANGDYHIGPGSAAINAGLGAGVGIDADYEPRPYQAPDLGADEYWPPGTLERLYLPIVLGVH